MYAPDPVTEVSVGHVHGQDVLLAIDVFYFNRQEEFLKFPRKGLFLRQVGVFDQLLGQGTPPATDVIAT